MITSPLNPRLVFTLALVCGATAFCSGSERRMTPLVQAIDAVRDSVVNIHSRKTAQAEDTLFAAGKDRKVSGMGTGIIVDERGYIVTNHHVVHEVDSLRVTLSDGSTFTAEVISYDRAHDLAIIRIHAGRPLVVMPLGTSSDVMLGESVFAVGNAFGYEHTVTAGIVSALSRDVEVNEKTSYENLIQTDASINPGNSGGPLLNMDGELVAINVAIRAGAQRIGFAIPIDDARKAIAKLLSVEHLNGVTHGVVGRDIKTATSQHFVIETVRPGSPAETHGLQPGDTVIRVDDTEVCDAADFERSFLFRKPNEPIEIEVERSGASRVIELALAPAPAGTVPRNVAAVNGPAIPVVAIAQSQRDSTNERAWRMLGIRTTGATAHDKSSIGPRYRGGLRIVDVNPGSPAAANGIRRGDVLLGLQGWETVSEDNLTYVLDQQQKTSINPLEFYVFRDGKTLWGRLRIDSASTGRTVAR